MLSGLSLSLLIGPVVPVPAPQVVLDALTEVEVTSAAGSASGFKLSFTLNNRSALHTTFLVAATRTALMRVIVIVTINSVPTVLMDGVITNQQMTAGSQPGQTSLTIIGEDLSKLMDLQELNGLPYPGMPQNVQVMAVLSKYTALGVVPLVIPPISLDVPLPTGRIPSHEGTDLHYVLELAEQVGYVFYVDPGPLPGLNTAYWGPEIKVGVPQPALSLDMDVHRNVESLSFSFDSANTDLPVVLIQNPLTKAPVPIPIPKINPLQPPLGAFGPPITRISMQDATAKLSAMQALGQGLAAASESLDAVTGSGSLDVVRYGHVLKSRKLVGVRGAGLAFDGLYYVKSVTSTIKRGEFKQGFELSRNGLVSITPAVPV
jgi:hypothetical protein